MNSQRRKDIQKLVTELDDLDFEGKLEDIKSGFEAARDDEQEYFDNMPEGLQGSEKGERAESAVSALGEIIAKLEEMIEALGEIQGYADTATE